MLDNPMCRFLDWKLANEYDEDGELKQRESDPEAEDFLKKWSEGQTGASACKCTLLTAQASRGSTL